MKPSDFKHIVKESLREAFYTKKVIAENLVGKKVAIEVYTRGEPDTIFPAVLSKNTIPTENPYRITWFSDDEEDVVAKGHVDMEINQFNKLMHGGQDEAVSMEIAQFIEADRIHIDLDNELTEGINGQRMTVNYYGETLPAVLSKNTKLNEKPYRISVFSGVEPRGHVELTQQEAEEILQNNKLPDDVIRLYGKNFKIVSINENLLLLENCSREIELWLENKIETIEESMNVVVSGANYQRTDRLDELVNYLQDTVVSPVLRTMVEPDQIAYFHKNSVGFWNVLSTDGSYHENPDGDLAVGTINLYPGGITSILLRKIVIGILRQLKKLGIKWGQLKREPSGAYKISDVIRFPIISNGSKDYQGPPELNLTNVNAYQIFHNVLQFEGEYSFTMDAKELMERIETLAHDKGWIDKNIIKRTDSDWPKAERDTDEPIENPHADIVGKIGNQLGVGGTRVIGMGLDSEGIEERLQVIWKIAKWAVDNGHKTISVG